MKVHENGKLCDGCAKMLEGGDELLSFWFYRIKEYFPTAHLAHVFRGKDDQDRMVKEGSSLLKWPNSKHNVMKAGNPCSRAMDIFSLESDGSASFRMGFYVQIANFLEDQTAPITWGGSWAHFKDSDHFQLNEGAG